MYRNSLIAVYVFSDYARTGLHIQQCLNKIKWMQYKSANINDYMRILPVGKKSSDHGIEK